MRIAILSDSSSGLIEQPQKNLFILPLPVILPDNSEVYDDLKNQATQEMIVNILNDQPLKTSSLNPGILEFKINQILEQFDFVFYFPIAYNLSGQYQLALNLLKHHQDLANKITVVKHYFTGIQLGAFISMLLSRIHQFEKKQTLKINDLINDWETSSLLVVIPGNLKILARGGRVNNMIANILQKKEKKIAIVWNHKPKRLAISKSYGKIVNKFVKKLADNQQLSANTEVYLATTLLCSEQIINLVTEQFMTHQIKVIKTNLPLIFAVHGGTDTIGLCAINN